LSYGRSTISILRLRAAPADQPEHEPDQPTGPDDQQWVQESFRNSDSDRA
jgi:hypothetical protein